jgi:diguanylate cyclase
MSEPDAKPHPRPPHSTQGIARRQAAVGDSPGTLGALPEVTVLMVDDEPMMTDVTQTYLEEAGYRHFVAVNDPRLALQAALTRRPGLVLLDLMMPGVSGYELLRQFRAHESLRYTPIIVLTAASDPASKLRALELGATEFLSKPVDATELAIRVRNSLAFKVYQDRLANDDPLTGLPNRRVLVEQLGVGLKAARLTQGKLALLLVNLDRFRLVNETLGHAAGDALLSAVADRLHTCARAQLGLIGNRSGDGCFLARLGGDEFAVLMPVIDNAEAAARTARQLLAAMAQPITVDGSELIVTPSIGAALYPGDGADEASLLRNAGVAMKHAKDSGRNTFQFYSAELNTASLERLLLEAQLRGALERQELELHYQPKVDLFSGRITGAEALMRWRHPKLGLVPPGRFIPIAEESGLIVPMGEWVLNTACEQMAQWRDQGLNVKVAVNVARHGLVSGALAPVVQAAMVNNQIRPGQLVLELTESMLMDRVESTAAKLHELRALGAELSIDDFGTGYSSMSYLKQFPVQEMKIDRCFIMGTPEDATDSAIVRALIVLAHSLNMRVVAEGVERDVQREALAALGCDSFQGFLCSPAVPAEAFALKMLENNARAAQRQEPGQAA